MCMMITLPDDQGYQKWLEKEHQRIAASQVLNEEAKQPELKKHGHTPDTRAPIPQGHGGS